MESLRQRGAQGVPYKYNYFGPNNDYHLAGSYSPIMPLPTGCQKDEFCRNWIESAKCRFEDKCRFAHAQE